MVGVEQGSEVRRLYVVQTRSKRAIHKMTAVALGQDHAAIESTVPPKYSRALAGSTLDPSTREWICQAAGCPDRFTVQFAP
jgi:hypothetical protein